MSKMPRYEDAVQRFRIEDEIARLYGNPGTGINAYVECCGRYTGEDRLALRAISAGGELREFSFDDLADMSGRAANVLKAAGVRAGDVVAGMLPRVPELVALILGTWRIGAVYQPLFTAFGPKAIEHRLGYSGARIVVTNPTNRGKLDEVETSAQIANILGNGDVLPAGDIDFRAALGTASPDCQPVMRKGDDLFMMMSTSGTTGLPKGVPVPLRALLAFGAYMRDAIGLLPDDIFWNIADPGWAYGLYYAITGPLQLGIATTFHEGAFNAKSTYDIIERLGVTSLAGSPTAYRLLMAEGAEAAARVKGRLRVVSSAGEPLNPEVIRWFDANLAAPIHDHYGQTENGMMVNNHHGLSHVVRVGSAGLAMPGYRMVVLDKAGNELGPNQPGILAVDIAKSPLRWFDGYHQAETPAITGGYYRTGDTVEYEPDGSVSFIGRADDVITSAGYRIGPFDVESALIEHPAVNEAAVVGVPDPQRTEIVKAFVVLAPAYKGNSELAEELAQHVKKRLSAHAYPREVEFITELPKTPSGKIQRFLLRKAEVEKRKA
ncbi:acyl-CoA synthetase [Mesorhizobium sp. LNJC394B00]|uniref:acyl-CoA synthetase n=1 Tax=Mesorhizobium sp. LNJC394B00 TaxID=1287274 RepID=UPI0003CE6A19|nr:acyl-CoA synthetase [Mesorhizobium sp. LNJC394B00]ESY25416.1 AMP-binding protein [Mesorhizobium sp. LNJC394B00]